LRGDYFDALICQETLHASVMAAALSRRFSPVFRFILRCTDTRLHTIAAAHFNGRSHFGRRNTASFRCALSRWLAAHFTRCFDMLTLASFRPASDIAVPAHFSLHASLLGLGGRDRRGAAIAAIYADFRSIITLVTASAHH